MPWYGRETPCERKLSVDEIKTLWAALPDSAAGRALKLLLLCGQRSSEIRLMTWAELEGNVLTIPGSRTKNGKTQVLPLPDQAMQLIEQQREVTGNGKYVFEGRRWGGTGNHGDYPMGEHTLLKRLKETLHAAGVEKASVHDLRRTFRSELSRLKVDVIVAEKLLNHKLRGILGTYDRHDYFEEKGVALQKWGDALERLVCPERQVNNVIQLPNKKAM